MPVPKWDTYRTIRRYSYTPPDNDYDPGYWPLCEIFYTQSVLIGSGQTDQNVDPSI